MNKKQFVEKWGIDDTTVYTYKKRFPEIFQNNIINYLKLDTIIQQRIDIKNKVRKLLKKKKAKELQFLFEGKSDTATHGFVKQLCAKKEQILVRDTCYKKYLRILEHFGEKHD